MDWEKSSNNLRKTLRRQQYRKQQAHNPTAGTAMVKVVEQTGRNTTYTKIQQQIRTQKRNKERIDKESETRENKQDKQRKKRSKSIENSDTIHYTVQARAKARCHIRRTRIPTINNRNTTTTNKKIQLRAQVETSKVSI